MDQTKLYKLNQKAMKFDKQGNLDKAIKYYEKTIKHNFDGSYPYHRLVTIYRENKDSKNVIRVLKQAVYVFENVVYEHRSDRIRKLEKFKNQLRAANDLCNREGE